MTNGTITFPGCETPTLPLGVGTWAWGDKATWGMDGYDPDFTEDSIADAWAASLDAGVTLFDTAEIYGRGESELIIGRLLASRPDVRDRLVIATKFIPFPWKVNVGRALLSSARDSCARLGVDHLDLYQLHGPISLRSHAALAEALATAHQQGLIRAVGVSNYSTKEMRSIHGQLLDRGLPLASNQIEYSLLRRRPEATGLLAACRELGVVPLAYSPIGQGRLTGKYSTSNPPPEGRKASGSYPMEVVDPVVAALREVGESHGGRTPSQVALNWAMAKGTVPIPGAKTAAQAVQNAGALGWTVSDDEMAQLDAMALDGQRKIMHRVWQHG